MTCALFNEIKFSLCGRFGSDLRCEFCCTLGVYADEFAFLALVLKLDKAFDQSKERVVLAAADIIARLPLRAALTRQDVAAEDFLPAEFL